MSVILTVTQENALSHLARGIRDTLDAYKPEINADSSVPALHVHHDGSQQIAAIKYLRDEVKHYTGIPMGLKRTKDVFDAIVAEGHKRKVDAKHGDDVVDAFLAVPDHERAALLERLQDYLPVPF